MSQEALYPPKVQLYIKRLAESLYVVKYIDSGRYPLSNYEDIPIHRTVEMKGLRHGLLFSAYGSYVMLKRLGYGKEAKEIVTHDQTEANLTKTAS